MESTISTPKSRLPAADIYEQEFVWWPWGRLVEWVVDFIVARAPRGGHVIDYMSGTGFMLRTLLARRPDLTATGCDLSSEFDDFARRRLPTAARTLLQDALSFRPTRPADVVVVTGGLHHLRFDEQAAFVAKLAAELRFGSIVLIGEEAIGPHTDERSRRLAALELGQALLRLGVEEGWPDPLLEAAIGVLGGDLLLDGEYKRDVAGWENLISRHLRIRDLRRLWTTPGGGGDVIFVCDLRA